MFQSQQSDSIEPAATDGRYAIAKEIKLVKAAIENESAPKTSALAQVLAAPQLTRTDPKVPLGMVLGRPAR